MRLNFYNYTNLLNVPYFKNGHKIHIKKLNRGKFTEYCGGSVTDECILRGKNSSDPKIRKRATFAANARKWSKKHNNGGKVNSTFDPNDTKNYIAWWYLNRPWLLLRNANEAGFAMKLWSNQINNLYKYKWYKSSKDLPYKIKSKLTKNDFNDEWVNGMTMPDYKIIYFNNPNFPGSSIQIHEGTHSLEPEILKTIIPKHIKLKPGVIIDAYLDDPDELNSRIMEFRYANNLNPRKKYTIEEIKKMKDFGDGGTSWPFGEKPLDILNRYDDSTLLYLINDLAFNDYAEDNRYYAKRGGSIKSINTKRKDKKDGGTFGLNMHSPSIFPEVTLMTNHWFANKIKKKYVR